MFNTFFLNIDFHLMLDQLKQLTERMIIVFVPIKLLKLLYLFMLIHVI